MQFSAGAVSLHLTEWLMARNGFYQLYRKDGALGIEHIRGTHRVFFSLHYTDDVSRADRIREMRAPKADNESWNTKGFWVIGFGLAKVRKVQSGRIGPETWELRRWLVGRIDPDKRDWQVMDTGLVQANEWQSIVAASNARIEHWISNQMKRVPCVIVLIGSKTADRPWVCYEIEKAWAEGKGVLGIRIHNLATKKRHKGPAGENPFDEVIIDGRLISEIVPVYDPPFTESAKVYDYIRENLDSWIRQAIQARNAHQT